MEFGRVKRVGEGRGGEREGESEGDRNEGEREDKKGYMSVYV